MEIFGLDSDCNEPDGAGPGSVQAQWLAVALAASTATWRFVIMHHTVYSSGTGHGSTPRMQWGFEGMPVDAVFSGHDHVSRGLCFLFSLHFLVGCVCDEVSFLRGVAVELREVRGSGWAKTGGTARWVGRRRHLPMHTGRPSPRPPFAPSPHAVRLRPTSAS